AYPSGGSFRVIAAQHPQAFGMREGPLFRDSAKAGRPAETNCLIEPGIRATHADGDSVHPDDAPTAGFLCAQKMRRAHAHLVSIAPVRPAHPSFLPCV